MARFLVSVRGSEKGYDFECEEYLEAWDLYHFFLDIVASDVVIDIVDYETGEVIQSSYDF